VSQALLDRLSRRSRQLQPPPRQELVAEFCRAVDWRDAKGRLSISSASVGLRRLERQGKVQLPPLRARTPGALGRGLWDDGLALPARPKLPARAEDIDGLRLGLITGEEDPAHPLWNRLIAREHPLGRRPLVGAQLRYLVACEAGVVGAFGFGPAAFHLACRDQWIGWSTQARQQNRERVIGLSRFLIRPGLVCANLASRCYGLILARVGRDWRERYGIEPVLVETYVDRQRHQGRSLAASNWRRLGQSQGRGRDDPRRQRAQSVKDVWVYELTPQARPQLQAHAVEALAPRSVFAPPAAAGWVEEEMAGVALGDERLNQRIRRMLSDRWERPGNSFYRSFADAAAAKAAYQLVENPRPEINLQSLLAPHQVQTARRMAAEAVVLLAQDTTTLSYNRLHQTQGLGPVGEAHSRGMFLHSLQAFRLDGIPLGTAWAEVWARAEASGRAHRNEQSVDEKESGRWVRALQAAGEWARQMPRTQVVVSGDRESDLYEVYDQTQALPKNVHVLVRAEHDRRLKDGTGLMASLAGAPLGGSLKVDVPRRVGRAARVARLELRWLEVEIQPPAVALKKSWPPLRLWAVRARKTETGGRDDPIEWVLLSTWPVKTLKMARRLVGWYALRWGIECWHKVLKVVCGVERRQMKSAQALERALALDMIVASRVLLLTRLGKEHPELPAEVVYTREELEVLAVVKKKEDPRSAVAEDPRLTVLQANLLVAMLAGFWGRAGDGHPGAQILAEGLRILQALVWYVQVVKESCARRRRRRRAPT